MAFETKREVLEWYERQDRTLSKEFVDSIPWHEVKNYPFDEKYVRVLLYMRDVEILTDMYHDEMKRTPTGKDKHISKFMERWGLEELTHGEVLNRFLNEAGYETGENWAQGVKDSVPTTYSLNMRIISALTNLIGEKFTATHMVFGAINELSTGQAYRRLIDLAQHPVLTMILKAIMREESAHTQFYWNVAKIELKKSETAQKIARAVIKHFWSPVGTGARSLVESDYTISTLFKDDNSLDILDRKVTKHVHELPGFDGLNTFTETIGRIIESEARKLAEERTSVSL